MLLGYIGPEQMPSTDQGGKPAGRWIVRLVLPSDVAETSSRPRPGTAGRCARRGFIPDQVTQ